MRTFQLLTIVAACGLIAGAFFAKREPRSFIWTKDAPSVPGYYWTRSSWKGTKVVEVRANTNEPELLSITFPGSEQAYSLNWLKQMPTLKMEWSGPIPEPK